MARNPGQETERRILKKIGARRQPSSGAIPGFPNDGVKNRFLIEVKSTEKNSLGIKRKWVEDLEENALTRGKIPALVLVFNKRGVAPYHDFRQAQEWVAIPRWKFEQLTRHWKRS